MTSAVSVVGGLMIVFLVAVLIMMAIIVGASMITQLVEEMNRRKKARKR